MRDGENGSVREGNYGKKREEVTRGNPIEEKKKERIFIFVDGEKWERGTEEEKFASRKENWSRTYLEWDKDQPKEKLRMMERRIADWRGSRKIAEVSRDDRRQERGWFWGGVN